MLNATACKSSGVFVSGKLLETGVRASLANATAYYLSFYKKSKSLSLTFLKIYRIKGMHAYYFMILRIFTIRFT